MGSCYLNEMDDGQWTILAVCVSRNMVVLKYAFVIPCIVIKWKALFFDLLVHIFIRISVHIMCFLFGATPGLCG